MRMALTGSKHVQGFDIQKHAEHKLGSLLAKKKESDEEAEDVDEFKEEEDKDQDQNEKKNPEEEGQDQEEGKAG